MDNPNIDNPNPKKEEYVIILDYCTGYWSRQIHINRSNTKRGCRFRYSWQSLYRIWKKG